MGRREGRSQTSKTGCLLLLASPMSASRGGLPTRLLSKFPLVARRPGCNSRFTPPPSASIPGPGKAKDAHKVLLGGCWHSVLETPWQSSDSLAQIRAIGAVSPISIPYFSRKIKSRSPDAEHKGGLLYPFPPLRPTINHLIIHIVERVPPAILPSLS